MPTINTSQKFDILFALFVAAIITANLIGTKIVTILGISVSVGIFAFPLTFLIGDAITEVYGRKRTNQIIYSALIAQIIIFIVLAIALALPPAGRYSHNDAYTTVFGTSLRIIIASLTAFLASQLNDILLFTWIKSKTHGRFLWLRSNLSTVVGQFIDTTVFMFIAFYQVTPKYDVAFLFSLIIPYWGLKILYSAAGTPVIYALAAWLRKEKNYAGQV